MNVLKDDKYNRILKAARHEFISKGFKDASMRKIAKGANVGLSNIYNYFSSKDEIMIEVLKPARSEIYALIDAHHKEADISHISTFGYQEEVVEEYISLIENYQNEIYFLLFQAEGSSFSHFRDDFTNYLMLVNINHMDIVRKVHPQAKPLSDALMHALSSWMVTILGDMVKQKPDRDSIKELFRELFRFEIAGWREIIGV